MQKYMVNVHSLVIELKPVFAGLVYIPILEGKCRGKDQLWL